MGSYVNEKLYINIMSIINKIQSLEIFQYNMIYIYISFLFETVVQYHSEVNFIQASIYHTCFV